MKPTYWNAGIILLSTTAGGALIYTHYPMPTQEQVASDLKTSQDIRAFAERARGLTNSDPQIKITLKVPDSISDQVINCWRTTNLLDTSPNIYIEKNINVAFPRSPSLLDCFEQEAKSLAKPLSDRIQERGNIWEKILYGALGGFSLSISGIYLAFEKRRIALARSASANVPSPT